MSWTEAIKIYRWWKFPRCRKIRRCWKIPRCRKILGLLSICYFVFSLFSNVYVIRIISKRSTHEYRTESEIKFGVNILQGRPSFANKTSVDISSWANRSSWMDGGGQLVSLNTSRRNHQTSKEEINYSQGHPKVKEPTQFQDKTHVEGHKDINNMTLTEVIPVQGHHQNVIKVKESKEHVVTTTVTFDPSLKVACKKSPFIVCENPARPRQQNQTFRIVALRRPGWMGRNSLKYTRCPYNKCITEGEEEKHITQHTDLVHVFAVGLNSRKHRPPTKRWPHQLYAISTWESPPTTSADFLYDERSVWNDIFNVTINYRADSDVFVPYSKLKFDPLPLNNRPNYYEIAKRKTKMAAWIVSNCEAPSRRLEYAKEMQKYMDVEIYGRCGRPCNETSKRGPCVQGFPEDYKFYLSFESTLCTDYVTEKFFKVFSHRRHIIPVVRGHLDYEKYFPNNTFVNADQFKTAKDLALYLNRLGSDLETYSKLLEYKDLYVSWGGSKTELVPCQLCEYLHTRPRDEVKTYNMKKWMGDGHCVQS